MQDRHWVTTWATAPSSLPPVQPENETRYNNQTLRQIVRTSAGGSQVRIRLSNVHGNVSLTIGAATIALQHHGSEIVPNTLKTLTFSRRPTITIPRGASVLSDPVELAVDSLTDLSISIYLPNPTSAVTTHGIALQTNWLTGAGNHVTATRFEQAQTFTSWDYLSGVDVLTDSDVSALVAVGDSTTDGYLSTPDRNKRWTDALAKRLFAGSESPPLAVINGGVTGNRLLREASPRLGENLLARLNRDVFALSGVSHIILFAGLNDIGMASQNPDEQVTADDLIGAYRQVIAKAHARGIKVIGACLLPYQGSRFYSDAGELIRQTVNTWIASSGEFDGVIDFSSVLADLEDPNRLKAKFTQDNMHPNDAGYQAMAESIDLALFE